MKKKIIFTVTNDLVHDRRMIRIGESLATEGYEVLLVGRKLKYSQPFINQYIKHKRFNLYFNKGKFFYIEYNIRLFFWLLFQRFDIICGIDLDTILPCYFASKLRGGKPCVYDAHELFTEVPEVIRRPFTRKIWLGVERFVVPRLKYKYTVSKSVADEFFRRYKSRFEVIRNLPNFTEPSPPPTPIHSLPVILYQGNLNEGRGLETAVQAMQYIENAVFWIAGDGDLGPALRGMVNELELEQKVTFLGYVQPKDLASVTQKATIGIHISEDKGLSYQFSLANKFLDYIQAGVPQICTQFVEYQRLNDEYEVAVLIEKTDIRLLVEAIQHLLSDPVFYNRLKQNCVEAAKILNWENEEKKLIQFYEL
jgi:glycosyltransferase involved in cell wall biosynthesis